MVYKANIKLLITNQAANHKIPKKIIVYTKTQYTNHLTVVKFASCNAPSPPPPRVSTAQKGSNVLF